MTTARTATITAAETVATATIASSSAAVLQVNNEADLDLVDDNTSVSSLDSFHDIISPMELGSVMNELQDSIVERQQQQGEHTNASRNKQQRPMSAFDRMKQQESFSTSCYDYDMDNHNKTFAAGASANHIVLDSVNPRNVQPNMLDPREQEAADEQLLLGVHHLFHNRFMKAKSIFEEQANADPAYTLQLGFMSFLKAIMSTDPQATNDALQILTTTCHLATAQINSTKRKHMGGSVLQYIQSYYKSFRSVSLQSGFLFNIKPAKPSVIQMQQTNVIPNGILRAHIAKGEACLQMAILYLIQRTTVGYTKCGVFLKRAYTSYNFVWQEYKRLGQLHNQYMDRDTIGGMQAGIASIHLLLSSLPQKLLVKVSSSQFNWKPDRHMGFVLLKLCAETRRSKAPTALLILLAYFTTTVGLCPQILASEYIQPAIETLLEAQQMYPHSAIFLYFAGLASRIARNLTLSTQSLIYAIETSKGEWTEVEMFQTASYEIAFNHMIKHEWQEAANLFQRLHKEKYGSPILCKYLSAACKDMVGQRTEAILAYAELLQWMSKAETRLSDDLEVYIQRKLEMFQSAGFQDMDMTLCALEYMYLFNAFDFMDEIQLEQSMAAVDNTLEHILEAEKLEYDLRAKELMPETPPPAYHNQRGVLLLIKAAILNAMGRYQYSIIHLNWILDHIPRITMDKWMIPYAFWESGVTAWNTEQKARARYFWEAALNHTDYEFETRMAMKVHVALTKAQEMNIQKEIITKRTTTMNLGYMYSCHPSSASASDYKFNSRSDCSEIDGDNTLDYDKSTIGTTTVSEPSTTASSAVHHQTSNEQSSKEEGDLKQVEHAIDALEVGKCD